jgi:hypothetical protein
MNARENLYEVAVAHLMAQMGGAASLLLVLPPNKVNWVYPQSSVIVDHA